MVYHVARATLPYSHGSGWLGSPAGRGKEVYVLAITILGVSIAGREILIIAAVIAIIVVIGFFLAQRRRPR